MNTEDPTPPDYDAAAPEWNGIVDDTILAPWGQAGPAPVGQWREDILGRAFESRTLPLIPEDDLECVATLIRYRPHLDPHSSDTARAFPHFAALYVHGRNDYFFHTELAHAIASAGGAFYAIDLRRYGRSLRPGQTMGFVNDMSVYDEDISEALDVIRSEVGNLPFVLIGHSTGGLQATLWAHRHPGAVDALILNSAWLEMQTMASIRPAMRPIIERIATYNPLWAVPGGSGVDFYGRSLREGWAGSDFPLPDRLAPYADDPAVRGWDYALEWKRPGSYPAYAAWLDAILEGHEMVENAVSLTCPVLSMFSTSTFLGPEWTPRVFTSDTVLDVSVIHKRSASLGSLVTLAQFPGRHDLFLSDPDVRRDIWEVMGRWLQAFVPASRDFS